MTNFTIDTANIEEQISYGNGHIYSEVEVVGFWCRPIKIRVKREYDWRASFEGREERVDWTFEVSHSSGGKDTKEVDALVSERYFGEAILATCDYVEQLKARTAELEAAYQNRLAIQRAEREAEEAAKAERVTHDPEIGTAAAKALVEKLIADARNTERAGESIVLSARVRGSTAEEDLVHSFRAERNWERRVQLYFCGSVISRKDAVAKVAELARKDARIGPATKA